MIFDTWGGVLADGAFQRYSLAPMRRIVERLQRSADGRPVPSIVFTKGGGAWLDEIAAVGADVVGVDWTVNLGRARARGSATTPVALQGNLDPCALFAPAGCGGARAAAAVLDDFRAAPARRWWVGRPRLQPLRARDQPAHAGRARGRSRRGGACAHSKRLRRHSQ